MSCIAAFVVNFPTYIWYAIRKDIKDDGSSFSCSSD